MFNDYDEVIARFKNIVSNKTKNDLMVALIIDSPWLPGYAGVNTLDFYFDSDVWYSTYCKAMHELAGVMLIPGSWVEYGMITEPSGWGGVIHWSLTSPPSMRHYHGSLSSLLEADVPNPETDGLMPVVLRQYERMNPKLKALGREPRIAAARGPLAVASHLIGITELLMAVKLEPEKCIALLKKTTELCIRWLNCQLQRMDNPIGVLVLDDIVGLMGPDDAEIFALPFLRQIFDSFPSLIRLYHNDTPNEKVFKSISTLSIDVFNFSHKIRLDQARELLGPDIVMMGNIPPVDVLVRGTVAEVRHATEEILKNAYDCGPVLISAGGGVAPETPLVNLKEMIKVVEEQA